MAVPFTDQSIFVAGHRGMVGCALVRHLKQAGHTSLLLRTRSELDLLDQSATTDFFSKNTPDIVIVAAAKVGGIEANRSLPADFCYENLQIAGNVIQAAHQFKTKRLLFLGSSCIYPREASQPIREESILTGPLETTNEAYAIAKIASLKLCQYFREQYGDMFHSAMPCNLYGPEDNYHPEHSHVIPALLSRFHEAKEADQEKVTIWGTGKPLREFLHVDDLASGCLNLLQTEAPPHLVNIGSGKEISIIKLAELIAKVVGYTGQIECDPSRPDGVPGKLLDNSKIQSIGWIPSIPLEEGLRSTYQNFLETLS